MAERTYKVRTPLFPKYSEVRVLLNLLEGVSAEEVRSLIRVMWDQTGTPQKPVDWSNPGIWIPGRLSGQEAQLAQHIWAGSRKTVNPRHIYGSYLFINSYALLVPNSTGIYELTEKGSGFVDAEDRVIRELDELEGIPQPLSILAAKTRGRRSDLLPEWEDFLKNTSKYGTNSTIRDTLRRRLANLLDRGLVTCEGIAYEITANGLAYVHSSMPVEADPKRNVLEAVREYNATQREELKNCLYEMTPYRFEQLVGELLESIGYEDVEVTRASGDKGIDVVGTVQFGITTVKEVVQVKRHKGNIGRQTLDQLRGFYTIMKHTRYAGHVRFIQQEL
jgi:restriction system protein